MKKPIESLRRFLRLLAFFVGTGLAAPPVATGSRDCCPPGSAAAVCTCQDGADPLPSAPQPPAPPPRTPLPPPPPVVDRVDVLALIFAFHDAEDCEGKLAKITVAKVLIPQDVPADFYCRRLFPSGTKVDLLHVSLPAQFQFHDKEDCIAKTTVDLVPSQATPVFPVGDTAEEFCSAEFTPDPPKDPH